MPRYRASWVLPIVERPISDGWVDVHQRRVVALGPTVAGGADSRAGEREIDLGCVAILPGLVNAHTHLELSGLRGRVAPAPAMPVWVDDLLARAAETGGHDRGAVVAAIDEIRRSGTVLVGDISNTLASIEPLLAAPLAAVVFREIIGFDPADASAVARAAVDEISGTIGGHKVRTSLAAHAPYSTAPALFEAIGTELDRWPDLPASVHLAESPDEIEFLRSGTGRWRCLLERLGAWAPRWTPPQCGPVAFLERVGWLDARVLVVHGVHLDDTELATLAQAGVTLVTCPRSNEWTGAGRAPVARFFASGVRLAVGTDSLASTPDLNLFAELAAMRSLAPAVSAADLLRSATLHGALALGYGDEFGSIAPGKSAELIAVELPESLDDVEEYLVSGIPPTRVRWIESAG